MSGRRVEMQGYEPFGSLLPGRNYSSDSYKWGFNGKPKDDEIYGATGTSYDFGARLYDPRVGRWLSTDPMAHERSWLSPYNFVQNNPINRIDPNGALDTKYEDEGGNLIANTNDGNDATVTVGNEHVDAFKKELAQAPVDKNSPSNNARWIHDYGSDMSMQQGGHLESWAATAFGVDLTGSALETMPGTFRLMRSNSSVFSPKYYGKGWGGGSAGRISTYKLSSVGKFLGLAALGAGTAMDGIGVVNYYRNGANSDGAVSPGKAGLNLGMGAYGLYVSPPVGLAYGALETFYPGGTEGFLRDGAESQRQVDSITNYKVRLVPFGPK